MLTNIAKENRFKQVIDKIAATPNKDMLGVNYKVSIHTPKSVYNVLYLVDIGIQRDYINNLTDNMFVNCIIPMGDYVKEIYPYRDNLEISIQRVSKLHIITRKYKALILNNLTDKIANYNSRLSKEELNKIEHAILKIQCIDKCYEALRNIEIHGVYRLTNVKDLMLGIIGRNLNNIKVAGIDISKMQVNITPPDNKRVYKHISIPPDVTLLNLPSYLQETDYGIYNGGIGTYIQHYDSSELSQLFIYPTHSRDLYSKPIKKLIIYNANTINYDNIKNSYRLDGDVLNIIGTSKTKIITDVSNNVTDKGVSFLAANPNKLLENESHPTDDKLYVSSKNMLHKQELYKVRDNNGPVNYIGFQDNLYKERSKILMRTFQIAQIQWSYCNLELIYPGMPVLYNYVDERLGVVTMVGTVISAASIYSKGTDTTMGLINIAITRV